MSRVNIVLKEHLEIYENFLKEAEAADTADSYAKAIKDCTEKIKNQYEDLKEVSDEYGTLMGEGKAGSELKKIADRLVEIFTSDYNKIFAAKAIFLADEKVMKAQQEFDGVSVRNPLFAETSADDMQNVGQVAAVMAESMQKTAERIDAETREITENEKNSCVKVLSEMAEYTEKFTQAFGQAPTARKLVAVLDSYIKKLEVIVPELGEVSPVYKALMLNPETKTILEVHVNKIQECLGEKLKKSIEAQKDNMSDKKVSKSVDKLGKLLNSIPI